jgi:hypothetical protein
LKYTRLVAVVLVIASPARAHHSDAGIDTDAVAAFEGTVIEYHWQNPHVYITVETTNERGETIEWEVQTSAVSVVSREGWTRDSLSPGDKVTVRAHPAKNGRPYGILESLEKEGGLTLTRIAAAPDTPATTTTLAGNWTADDSSFTRYPGGFDGFFRAHLKLTEKARIAQADFDPLSSDNPDASCLGRPTPAAIISTNLYLMQIEINEDDETVLLRSERFDEERTVHMDGRGHPGDGERFTTGHSIGHWEGDTLVVDTANFTDHRSPYQIGIPSGAQKHVVERYRLTEDGTRLEVEFMLEDPKYLLEPMSHTRKLIYSPHMKMFLGGCDPDAARRFVDQ